MGEKTNENTESKEKVEKAAEALGEFSLMPTLEEEMSAIETVVEKEKDNVELQIRDGEYGELDDSDMSFEEGDEIDFGELDDSDMSFEDGENIDFGEFDDRGTSPIEDERPENEDVTPLVKQVDASTLTNLQTPGLELPEVRTVRSEKFRQFSDQSELLEENANEILIGVKAKSDRFNEYNKETEKNWGKEFGKLTAQEKVREYKKGQLRGETNRTQQEIKKTNDTVASGIWKNDTEREKNKSKFDKALSEWKTKKDPSGLAGFFLAYREAREASKKGKERKMNILKRKLQKNGLNGTEIQRLFDQASNTSFVDEYLNKLENSDKTISLLTEDIKNGTNYADELVAKAEKAKEEAEARGEDGKAAAKKTFDEGFAELAKDNAALREVQEYYEKQNELNKAYKVAIGIAVEEVGERNPRNALALDVRGSFDSLETAQKEHVSDIVKEGGAPIVSELLRHGTYDPERNTTTGMVNDTYEVMLHWDTGELELIGEKAVRNVATPKSRYVIEPRNPSGFDKTLIRMVPEQNGISFLSEKNYTKLNIQIANIVASNVDDDSLMKVGDLNRYRTFTNMLFQNAERGHELERVYDLGIQSEGSNDVNPTRLQYFRRAMDEYVPFSRDKNKNAKRHPMRYEDFQTLALIWNQAQNEYGTKPASLEQLRDLADIVVKSNNKRNVIDQFLKGTPVNEIREV